MNELIFLLQITVILSSVLGALALGKQALVSLVCVSGIMANLCVLKQTTLFGFEVTTSDAYMVAAILGLNVLQEYFGKEYARQAIWISLASLILYMVLTQIHLAFIPSLHDSTQAHFQALFAPMPRIMIASIIVYFVVQKIDYYVYGFFKALSNGRFFVARNLFSLSTSQFLDTVLFSFLGLYGLVSSVWEIIFFSFTIKMIIILLSTPFIGLTKRIVKGN